MGHASKKQVFCGFAYTRGMRTLTTLLQVMLCFAIVGTAQAAPAASAAAGTTFRDCPSCPEMVVIPAGAFSMGTLARHRVATEVPAELEPVRVTVTHPFALGRYEVTRGEYGEFAAATGRNGVAVKCRTWVEAVQGFRDLVIPWDAPNVPRNPTPRHPATCIDWHDAVAYAAWLSAKTGRHYRLPSEAEWEYAAKAGTDTLRHWGDDPDAGCEYANTNDRRTRARYPLAWAGMNCDDGFEDVAPVGSLKPNRFGLYDMIGNVWEWAEDCSSLTYHGRPTDARAWVWDGGCKRRIQRAGGWSTGPERTRSAFHGDGSADDRADFAGFRVALDLDPAAPPSIEPVAVAVAAASTPSGDATRAAGTVFADCKDCPELVVVPAGKFMLGSSADEYEHDVESGETPALAVEIRKPYALGRFEITQAQFARFLTESGHQTSHACARLPSAPALPARCISRRDAEAYVAWLTRITGQRYRLPSESEWEYAARAGTTGARFWSARDSHEGVSISRACDYANVYDVSARALNLSQQFARCTDHYPDLAPVGSFLPNGYGLYDMIGNVREVLADCHTKSYKGRPADDRTWSWSGCHTTVIRGASFRSRPFASRSASRDGAEFDAPEAVWKDVGLRVAREL